MVDFSRLRGASDFEFAIHGEDLEVSACDRSWVSVRNLSAASGLEPGQDLLESNQRVEDGAFRLKIPDAKYGDYVQVTQVQPGGRKTHQVVQLRAHLAQKDAREVHSERQTFALVEDGEGQLRPVSARKSQQFGPPKAQVWFKNAGSGKVSAARLGEDGRLPADFRLKGGPLDDFQVVIKAEPQTQAPDFSKAGFISASIRGSAEFDHEQMLEHSGPLFSKGISWDDPLQGQVGNCWFVASVSALASARPDLIERMIKPLGNGRYEVTFHRYEPKNQRYEPDRVVVKPSFYRDMYGGPVYGRSRGDRSSAGMELWFPILEKAYAQLRGSYRATRSGSGIQAFERLLGAPAIWLGHDKMAPEHIFIAIQDATKAKQPIYTATPSRFGWKRHFSVSKGRRLVPGHAYTLLEAYERDGERYVKLRNPWGRHGPTKSGRRTGVFELKLETFLEAFEGIAVGRLPKAD